jgi:hypothetical protein
MPQRVMRAAALRAANGGTATAVEREAERGEAWEVEVRRADRTTVDVALDAGLQVVADDGDGRGEQDDDADAREGSEAG